ncbi:MAG: FAD-dependent thymidylate synthase [Clostridia bacterium]|nr:FAD-dependent thymidylate synthase [Clostridia bacterium]
MKIIEPSFQWLNGEPDGAAIIASLARAGRVCYQSEPKNNDADFIRRIIMRGHESVLEHEKVSVMVVCDRGVTHEIVRHRIAAYSQESTRYCCYAAGKFGGELTFIRPLWMENETDPAAKRWIAAMEESEKAYMELLELGWTPEKARSVLPNSLKTQIVMTMDIREWRHFFRLRCDEHAHPQMRQVADMLLDAFRKAIPVVFDEI